jgi:hypothetical protein
MADELIQIADQFWNIRGSFKLAGLIDVGTQSSLVQLQRGDFVLLDSYALTGDVERQVRALTDQGRAIRAVLNLHPFHTVHVPRVAEQFPNAELYGTSRHKRLAPSLRWQSPTTDDPRLHELFADDFSFTVPRGVDLVPSSSRLHFASVLAQHLPSSTLHVDDTLSWSSLPLMRGLSFHPTLRFALHKRAGAAAEFRAWAEQLITMSGSVRHLCTAHSRKLPDAEQSVSERVRGALRSVSGMLDAHARRYG